MFSEALAELAKNVLRSGKEKGFRIVTAESCTGGLVAAALTEIPGSSDVFDRGYVTYSNMAKEDCLNVPPDMLIRHGAVSAEVAEAMAQGALANSQANIAVSITGIAGPGGGSENKPIGLVYIGIAQGEVVKSHRFQFSGDRQAIRMQTVTEAIRLLNVLL